jgi:hypothetical protein
MKRELHKAFNFVLPGERLDADRWRDFNLRLPFFRLGDEASDAARASVLMPRNYGANFRDG